MYHVDHFTQYVAYVRAIPLLTPDEEQELARQLAGAKDGAGAASALLVHHNQRLVVWIVGRMARPGLDKMDAIQEGMIGLIRAAELYHAGRGRFATFARWHIRARIRPLLRQLQETPISLDEEHLQPDGSTARLIDLLADPGDALADVVERRLSASVAVAALDEEHRPIVLDYYAERHPLARIGKARGLSKQAVYRRKGLGLTKMRAALGVTP